MQNPVYNREMSWAVRKKKLKKVVAFFDLNLPQLIAPPA
jgi:hypothetical protein